MTKNLLVLAITCLLSAPIIMGIAVPSDYASVASVDTAWVRIYNGPINHEDKASAIGVDDFGNIYVTGSSWGDGTYADYLTVKYYPNGDTAWTRRYSGSEPHTDEPYALAEDDSGNTYVTGYTYGNSGNPDYTTIKYNRNGDIVRVEGYGGPANGYDKARAIAIDDEMNVYVTGSSEGNGSYDDYVTIKYYPNGDTAWLQRYDGPTSVYDWALAIVVDRVGNVYVTGEGAWDYTTIKYYPNGDTAWIRKYNGPANGEDEARDIAVDSAGNVYVTGMSQGTGEVPVWGDYATIKYYSNGETAWVRRYDGPVNLMDEASAIAVDFLGNVYITGGSTGYDGYPEGYDYTTIKYYPNGDTAWIRRYNGPDHNRDFAYALSLDRSGSVYVTGLSGDDIATIKYDSSGNELWVQRYPGWGWTMAIDDNENIYVTGWNHRRSTLDDFVTIKYVQFLRGDVNRDEVIDLQDVVYLISYLFQNNSPPIPILQAGDVNCNGIVDIEDVIYLINYTSRDGSSPCI
jgi:hypothetical protein